jgi:hypothetical protein
MYHEVEANVDVELLAECGQIAQRLRSLEQAWHIDLKELQRNCLCNFGSPPALTSSASVAQKLSNIYDLNEEGPELVSHLKHLEDVAIGIYCQRELQRQALLKERDAKNNMNHSATAGNSNAYAPPTRDNNGELQSSWHNDEGDKDQKSSTNTTNGNKQPQHTHHQQQLCDKITNDDLQLLLRELRRKVDFTEKMNWLCEYRERPTDPFLCGKVELTPF